MKKVSLVALLILVLAALLAACGGDDSSKAGQLLGSNKPGGSSSDGPLATGPGSCDVTVSGDVTAKFSGKGGASAVGSDYWMTDDEMRNALSMLSGLGNKQTDAEKKKSVDEAMSKDPRLYLLILNCVSGSGDSKNSLSLLPSGESKYADVPFKAGQYSIPAGGLLGGADKAGEFSVLLTLGKDAYKVSKAGQLNITKFDKTGIAGTFNFGGEEGFPNSGAAKKINVDGKFDFPCTGGGNCKK